MDDIKHKSLKEVLPARGLAIKEKAVAPKKQVELINYYKDRQGRGGRLFVGILIALVFLVGGYYLSTYFTLITIHLTSKQVMVPADGQYQAEKSPSSASLIFSTVTAADSAEMTIPATGSQKVSKKASGQVIIYNNYSSASQKIVANSRLEAKGGQIFRLSKTVTVPGLKKSGQDAVPGSVLAEVTADQAGANYNLGLVDLSFVGFKGTAKYDKFVARSKTPIGGGMLGEIKIASEADKTKARAALQKTLTDRLVKKTKLQVPKDFVLFDDAVILNFSDALATSTASSTQNQVVFTEQLSLAGILFNKKNLAEQLLAKASSSLPAGEASLPAGEAGPGDNIDISNLNDLHFKLLNKDSFDPDKTNKISFTLGGQAKVVWVIDAQEIKGKLAGTSISGKDQIFAGYPNIYKAETAVRPPWILHFPADQAKIVVLVAPAP